MSGEKDKDMGKENIEADADRISDGVAEVFDAALGVGTAIAKTIAEATAGGREIEEPVGSKGSLNAIIHYSLAAVTNVLGAVVSTVGGEESRGRTGDSSAAAGGSRLSRPATPGLPMVHRGATLKIPLSIENVQDEPMQGMNFACLAMNAETDGPGKPLEPAAVRFDPPEDLSIDARDFEKLTVFIETTTETAPGLYEATIGLEAGLFETRLRFRVTVETRAGS